VVFGEGLAQVANSPVWPTRPWGTLGVIGLIKVVTGAERRARPELVQPGDREWVTEVQSICAARYAIPPFIIYKGRVYISTWYKEALIPRG